MAKATKTITRQELIAKIKDIETTDEEIAQYFIVDDEAGDAFSPKVIPNPKLVDDGDLEGALALNFFNRLARLRRNAIYRNRLNNWDGVKVVAEGDSWFQYPLILKDTIDQLCDLNQFQYAIYGLSEAGDLLANMVHDDEITEALERENPDILLLSGGGNDMVGDGRAATLVHEFSPNRNPENYPNDNFSDFLQELAQLYRDIFTRVLAIRPHLKIICHGYDNAIPQDGRWLGRPLQEKNITDKVLQRQIVAEMIRRFNEVMSDLASEFSGSVYHVDCQRVVGTKSKWYDELHPRNEGYFKVAEKFDAVIKQALAESSASPAIELSKVPSVTPNVPDAANVKLAQMQKLNNQEFLNLVMKRAELIMGKPIPEPTTRYERQQIEKDISEYYEKIHKGNNFLPSSFLEDGVRSAQSVCRIETQTDYGSGFLIGSRNFIMTNNHVIPDAETARTSEALFDYDEDNIEYHVNLRPDEFFITDIDLDFTIIACDSTPLPTPISAIPLLRDTDTITRGERVNIIQHPQGRRKEISLHDNKINYVYDVALRYTADTEGGSSGSPVFNNQWNLVGLHHAGWSHADGSATNEGIRIAAIVEFLFAESDNESSSAMESLLACVQNCDDVVHGDSPQSSPPADASPAKNYAGKSNNGKSLTLNIDGDIDEITINLD